MSRRTIAAKIRHRSRRRPAYLEFLESRLLLSTANAVNVAWSNYFGGADDGTEGQGVAVDYSEIISIDT